MPQAGEPLANFNVDTMSGVYPGTRTAVYQRLSLVAVADPADVRWFQLLWYTEPGGAWLLPWPLGPSTVPLLTMSVPPQEAHRVLLAELPLLGWTPRSCAACRSWHSTQVTNDDGLVLGRCKWRPPASPEPQVPDELALQSALALACPHFQPRTSDASHGPETPAGEGLLPTQRPHVPKAAELDPDRLPYWTRLKRRLADWVRPAQPPAAQVHHVVERSGVGAGTEPCFCCQGRLANLGAVAVASPEGDKQTLSVWRCRQCATTYLNDWTDRWERLESLETEEMYFRIAPAEATEALDIIQREIGGDHPGERSRRHHARERLLALVAHHKPLSHQVRQGR